MAMTAQHNTAKTHNVLYLFKSYMDVAFQDNYMQTPSSIRGDNVNTGHVFGAGTKSEEKIVWRIKKKPRKSMLHSGERYFHYYGQEISLKCFECLIFFYTMTLAN